jgi:hypothetical protein
LLLLGPSDEASPTPTATLPTEIPGPSHLPIHAGIFPRRTFP